MDRKDLDRPEYGSYEDVHEQLVQAMQEACMNDTSREYKTPDIDMSFLYDDTVVPETKTKHRFTRFNKVAAIVIAALLGLNAVLLISDSNEVYSEKGLLHRICEGARGIFTDEDPSQFMDMDDTGEVFIINDMKDIEKAKEFWPDLCVPEYVPDGYYFNELNILEYVSKEYRACYKFTSENQDFEIWIYSFDYPDKYFSNSKGQIIRTEEYVFNIYHDEQHKEMIVDMYLGDLYICICGNISKDEMIKIAKNIYKK